MKSNLGFTLIELIVVMVIMGIVAVGSVTGYHLLDSRSARNASELIVSVLDYVQMENMTKSKSYSMEIVKVATTGKYLIKIVSPTTEEIVSTESLDIKNGEITFYINNDPTQHILNTTPIDVQFRKDTGGMKESSPGIMIIRIGITSSGRTFYIRLVPLTGKHYIEQ